MTGKHVQRDKFSRKNRFICTFCLGKNCSKELWQKTKGEIAIRGLNSNLIEDKIVGSQRPSTRLIQEHQVIDQMLALNIGMIVNLQEPGEHSLCGDGINDEIGFSYNPE